MLTASLLIPSPATATSFDQARIRLHGYVTLEYIQASENEGHDRPNAPDRTNGAFDFHHVNLLADIYISPRLVTKLNIEFDHGADTELDHGDIILEFGFFEYMAFNWLSVRGGKTLTPFGLFNEIHDASPAYLSVYSPENIYKAHMRGGFNMAPKWNVGLTGLGELFVGSGHHDIYYQIYVGNGESRPGTNASQYDDNPNKAVGGRVLFSTHDGGIQAGASAFYGDKALTEDNLAVEHYALLFSVALSHGGLDFKAEYGLSELNEVGQIGWFVQLAYAWRRLTPYFRYQAFEPNVNEDNDHWNTVLFGLNYKVGDNMFLKAEWNSHDRGRDNAGVVNEDAEAFSELRLAVTLFF